MISIVKSELDIEEDKYLYLIMESVKTHEVCATIIPSNTKKKCFNELTGSFPHKYSHGNLYGMVVYDFDSNEILAGPIKIRQAATIRDAFIRIHKVLKSRGKNPRV